MESEKTYNLNKAMVFLQFRSVSCLSALSHPCRTTSDQKYIGGGYQAHVRTGGIRRLFFDEILANEFTQATICTSMTPRSMLVGSYTAASKLKMHLDIAVYSNRI